APRAGRAGSLDRDRAHARVAAGAGRRSDARVGRARRVRRRVGRTPARRHRRPEGRRGARPDRGRVLVGSRRRAGVPGRRVPLVVRGRPRARRAVGRDLHARSGTDAVMSLLMLFTWLLGGIAALDATPVGQTLLSQPLVTATALAFLWGDWKVALEVGIVLQVLAASTLPVGARTPEDYAVGGVTGTGLALALASQQPFEMTRSASALAGVIVGLLAARFSVPLLKWQRRRNEALARWCESELLAGHSAALGLAQAAAVVLAFAVGVGFTALAIGAGFRVLHDFVSDHSIPLSRAWTLAEPLWLGLGLAQLLHAFVQRRLTR